MDLGYMRLAFYETVILMSLNCIAGFLSLFVI